jgi:hypothetical protein
LLFSLAALPACAASPPAATEHPQPQSTRPTDKLETGGRVGLSAFALAGRVTWQGMWTVGRAAGDVVTGDLDGASKRWRIGADQTKAVARRESAKVKQSAAATPATESPATE